MEVQIGEYTGEDDIVRIEDDYGGYEVISECLCWEEGACSPLSAFSRV
ncbi:hypothetical protein [Methanocalculus sp.]